jgi:hypothetical protein
MSGNWLEPESFKRFLERECKWPYKSELENIEGVIKGPVYLFSTVFRINYNFLKRQLKIEVDFSSLFGEVDISVVENKKIYKIIEKSFGAPMFSNCKKVETVCHDYSTWRFYYPIFFFEQRPMLGLTLIDTQIWFIWEEKEKSA